MMLAGILRTDVPFLLHQQFCLLTLTKEGPACRKLLQEFIWAQILRTCPEARSARTEKVLKGKAGLRLLSALESKAETVSRVT